MGAKSNNSGTGSEEGNLFELPDTELDQVPMLPSGPGEDVDKAEVDPSWQSMLGDGEHGGAGNARRDPPFNLDAEQALLGAILFNNEIYNRVMDLLLPAHFFDPVHAHIYEQSGLMIARGNLASATLIKDKIDPEALAQLGGQGYLALLLSRAASYTQASNYAQTIRDLADRRELIAIGGDLRDHAFDTVADAQAKDIIEATEQKLFRLAETGRSSGGLIDFKEALTQSIKVATAAYAREGGFPVFPAVSLIWTKKWAVFTLPIC